MLLETNLLEDERVKKECMLLSDNGYEVHVLFPEFPGEKASNDSFSYDHIVKHNFQASRNKFNKFMGTSLILPFYFRMWEREAMRVIHENGPFEMIYIHDLPLSEVGIRIKRKLGIKLVCDQHEFYSDWIVRAKHMNTTTGKIVKALSNWKKFEAYALREADLVVSVTPELCANYIREITGLDHKIVSLPNTPMKKIYLDPALLDQKVIEKYKDQKAYRAIYVGATISFERGLDLMIDAIPAIVEKIPEFRFMVLGNVHSSYDILAHIEKNKVSQYVEMIGKVPNNLVPTYLSCASIGLNLHDPHSAEINNTIPTKIFQYIALGLSVVSTDCKLITELVNEQSIGEIIGHSAESLAEHIISMLESPEKTEVYQANTEKLDSFFWETTSQEWMGKMKELLD